MASPSQYFPTPFHFLKVHTANTEESWCQKNCKIDCARARRVLAGGAASESDAVKV
ncbi:unnamed protein product [Brassica napus]|uniref:(rape) hypothetical protein n=1 Tax=Brassica napus TaxID=3708 RepID=A0A816NY76_BRANA|nr:unnamed protein product [Brassica napus]